MPERPRQGRAGQRRLRSFYRRSVVEPLQKHLLVGVDHGTPIEVSPHIFGVSQRGGGWGAFAQSFIRMNEATLNALDTKAELAPSSDDAVLRLIPGSRAGAIPLRSAQTGRVCGGFVVRPRFGWAGVGSVLGEIGWHACPEFVDAPLVPGSGREVPPWVLAGPIIVRLESMLRELQRGYSVVEEVLSKPRGKVIWNRYSSESLGRGYWERLPCRFPDLGRDEHLCGTIRWALERLRRNLLQVGGKDRIATELAKHAQRLVESISGVRPVLPNPYQLKRLQAGRLPGESVLRSGLEAIAWIVDERGLGGGRELDGLAWQLPLDRLWEMYVESTVRTEASVVGGDVKVARLGQTTFPLQWSDPSLKTLGHLAPDIVVRCGQSVQIIDAKYKAHLAELDEAGWHRFADHEREAHRADLHQVLAYASLYQADEVTAVLVYPVRQDTWEALRDRGRDSSRAELLHGGRRMSVELRGLPFGKVSR